MSSRSFTAFSIALLALSSCSPTTAKPAVQPPPPPAPAASARAATTPPRSPRSDRERFLEMFARGYYPGRSGQIFVVPREGDFITYHDPLYYFMHGSPWSYDTRIPVLFYGAPFVRPGQFTVTATQQDIVPTLAAILGTPPPVTITGHALREALGPSPARPKIIALFVFDAMRVDYFDRYADVMPTLSRLRREGAWFSRAEINYLPTVTSVGHATIGTGTDPRFHGQAANNLFNRATGKPQQAYDALDPRELMVMTLADLWNLQTNGRAIIIGQGGAMRATAGLVGHGSCLVGAKPVIASSYSTADAGWETNPSCYRMPEYLKPITGKRYWEVAGGAWMGHDITNPSKFRASSLFQRFEGDALLTVLDHEAIGADEVTDLVMVNMKGPDYNGHAYGPDSPEIKEALAELDRQMTKVVDTLQRKAGAGQFAIAITADHGMPPEPKQPGGRHYFEDTVRALHQRFDPEGKIVQYFDDPANLQIYMDTARMQTLGVSLTDVARFLESQPYIAAAFTEDDVRAVSVPVVR